MTAMPTYPLRIADLPNRKATRFALKPDHAARNVIAAALGIDAAKKLTFEGEIAPSGPKDWVLTAKLGATVVQPCVVTLAPVTTRIDEPINRTYLAALPEISSGEVEMPEDDTIDALPDMLDIAAVMIEALSLALPPFPRAPDAEASQTQSAPPGVAPMTDDDAKPFAGLKDLRAALEKKGDDSPE